METETDKRSGWIFRLYRWCLNLLFPHQMFQIISGCSPETILQRLNENTKGSIWFPNASGRIFVGNVGNEGFEVARNTFPYSNGCAPVFSGTIEKIDNGSAITAEVQMNQYARIFIGIIFGFMLFWTALALLAISIIFALMVPLMIANPRTVLGLWPGIAMPFGGPAIIVLTGALVQFFWRLDYTKTKETLLTLLEPCTLQEPTTPDNGPADR